MALIGLIPEVLIKIGISDLLNRLNVVYRIDAAIVVVHVNTDFFECTLRQQEPLYPSQSTAR